MRSLPNPYEIEPPRFVLRVSHVFNADQVDRWEIPRPPVHSATGVNDQVAAFVAATRAEIRHGFSSAYYRNDGDYIAMPSPSQFVGTSTSSATDAYFAILLHELTHWTGAPHRLDRIWGKRFGDLDYAFEELIAELGAAFLCSALRIVNEPRPDHAAYIANWLKILQRDCRAIFAAARLAQQAVKYLHLIARE